MRTESLCLELVLKEWFDLTPSMEFRGFVVDKKLVGNWASVEVDPLGISQRDVSNCYDFLDRDKELIEEAILKFFQNEILNVFKETCCNYISPI